MRKEKTVDFHVKWAWHAISRMYNSYAARYDMTMAIGYVLLNIDLENGTPATKIGPSIGMEPRSLTRTLKNLEERGWIKRETDENDKRFVNVYLTEEGKIKREVAREGVIAFNQMVREQIPLEKLVIFFEVITELNRMVDDENVKVKADILLNEATGFEL
ncbi:MAG: MarR family transcriptional regulator [Runella slithyformis]|jgi:MarR family transcriptional regulator, organic hydroperoxide resistance regulator|nr:MAG: MarR family transcriptional regulator [Runella slithyformis]TAF97087.1 MAG: MarR family transcriptional regulator [Runella sp.]TAG21569.1 MAG: MarR family transcriptional regulator [Cytophagales bacterium]TAG40833.1 MAG: MarR family transcriptional regulator [Cytophagia bacterium]TAF27098.1 MAG: MarR family transcriptional regulator [Runella slithyformis]